MLITRDIKLSKLKIISSTNTIQDTIQYYKHRRMKKNQAVENVQQLWYYTK